MYIKSITGEAGPGEKLLLGAPCVVALGAFDGLHKGHMSLVRETVSRARRLGLVSCVFTFPTTLGGAPRLTSNEQRAALLREQGVDALVMREFSPGFRRLSPEAFFQDCLIGLLGARAVTAGFNYRFGYMGSGDSVLLEGLCRAHGLSLRVMPAVLHRGMPISATRIRSELAAGAVGEVNRMLGREFSISGRVVDGDKIGRTLGFPTANIAFAPGLALPGAGVYVTKTIVEGVEYPSVTSFGGKPTIKEDIDRLESHILGFDKDIYGAQAEIRFVRRIRGISRFSSPEALTERMKKDAVRAGRVLGIPQDDC